MKALREQPIAVVGMGCVFPNAFNLDHYWDTLIKADVSAQRAPGPEYRWNSNLFLSSDRNNPDKSYSGLAGCIDGFQFDSSGLNISESEARSLSVLEKWLLTSLKECLGTMKSKPPARSILLVGGTGVSDGINGFLLQREYLSDFKKLGLESPELTQIVNEITGVADLKNKFSEYSFHKILERVCRRLLSPTSEYMIVDSACASSLYAIDFGIRSLLEGKTDIAFCGGTFAAGPVGLVMFSKINGLATQGCFPFDERADGTLFGDGSGTIALKRLSDALNDGDQIFGVIRGLGMSSDGKGKAVYAPSSKGQVLAIRRAYSTSQIDPKTIQYVEAHATGTPLGDATEYSSLATFFNENDLPEKSVDLGSVKGLFGHLGWTAGVASFIKVLLAMKEKTIPPQANFKNLSPKIQAIPSPFKIRTDVGSWKENRDQQPRRAAISGFGFGGTNAHVILEEYQEDYHAQFRNRKMPQLEDPEIVVVAIGTNLPATQSTTEAQNLLATDQEVAKKSFGDIYPVNALKYKMIPRAAKVTDATQFMILDAFEKALVQFGENWKELKERADFYVGHMGSLSTDVIHAKRIFWDPLKDLLGASPNAAQFQNLIRNWESQIRDKLPVTSEDSFPGMMPNLLPGRISNFHDIQGATACVNSGAHSFISAFELGCQALTYDQADLAFVGAVNLNQLGCYQELWKEWLGASGPIGEGALVFALMRKKDAQSRALPILGHVQITRDKNDSSRVQNSQPFGNLWNAAPAVSLLKALSDIKDSGNSEKLVSSSADYPFSSSIRASNGLASQPATGSTKILRYVSQLVERPLAKTEDTTNILPGDDQTIAFVGSSRLLREWKTNYPKWRFVIPKLVSDGLGDNKTVFAIDLDDKPAISGFFTQNPAPLQIYFALDFQDFGNPVNHHALMLMDRLHFHLYERWFESLKDRSVTSLFLNAWSSKQGIHPYVGLFAGFSKALQAEIPGTRIKAIFTDETDSSGLASKVRAEERDQDIVAYYKNGRRQVHALLPSKLLSFNKVSIQNVGLRLTADSLVIAFGGARGITGASVDALLDRYNCRVVMVGSTDLAQYDLNLNQEMGLADFVRMEKAKDPKASVKEIQNQYYRYEAARKTKENLERHLRAGKKVSYESCDVTDSAQVAGLVKKLRTQFDQVDLVIYGSGVSGPTGKLAGFGHKSIDAIQKVKIDGLLHISRELSVLKPKTFAVFSSISSHGIDGQAVYCGASDFQNTFCEHMNATQTQSRYLSIAWPGWSKVGMLAVQTLLVQDIEKSKRFSLLAPEDGVECFIQEILSHHKNNLVTIFAGKEDLDNYTRHRGRIASELFYIDRVFDQTETSVQAERRLNLSRDSYLLHHLVNGDAVLPGMFELEIAAEVASLLFPGQQLESFEKTVLHRFVKVFPGEGTLLRIEANRKDHRRVNVRIFSDFISPKGAILEKDRLHFETDASFADQLPVHSQGFLQIGLPTALVLDPYHEKKSAVYLDDLFVTVVDRKRHQDIAQGIYRLREKDCEKWPDLARFMVPSLLLDGALRLATTELIQDRYVPMMVPLSIERIQFHEGLNDLAIRAKYGELTALCQFKEEGPDYEIYTPQKNLFLSVHGLRGHTMGYIDSKNGDYLKELPAATDHKQENSNEEPVGALIGKIILKSDSVVIFEKEIDLKREFFLRTSARLKGVAVFAGAFQMEVAIEAANYFIPSKRYEIENMEFLRALKLFEDRKTVFRTQVERLDERRLRLKFLFDVIHPSSGKILQKDVTFSTMEVVGYPDSQPLQPLVWDGADAVNDQHIPSAYYSEVSPLHLGEFFVSVWDTHVSGGKVRCIYRNPAPLKGALFSSHVTAPFVLDAIQQTTFTRRGDYINAAIPKRIRRVRIPRLINDLYIVTQFDHLVLLTKKLPHSEMGTLLQALTPDGEVLCEIEGLEWTRLGTVIDTRDGKLYPDSVVPANTELKRMSRTLELAPLPPVTGPVHDVSHLQIFQLNQTPFDVENFGKTKEGLVYIDLDQHSLDTLERGLYELGKATSPDARLIFVVQQKWMSASAHFAPNPLTGLVTGFIKSLRAELKLRKIRVLVTDQKQGPAVLDQVRSEMSRPGENWISYHRENLRFEENLVETSLQVGKPLPENAVILVTGGGRGITAEIVRELGKKTKYTLLLLGRTEHRENRSLPSKGEFLKGAKQNHPEWSMIQTLSEYDRLSNQVELGRNILELSKLTQSFEYFSCDVIDESQVELTLEKIYKKYGKIDYVIHGSGIDQSSLLTKKSFSEFRSVIDTKILGFKNLQTRLRMENLKGWLNFGSIHGIFGTSGQTDYCAANECLNSFADSLRVKYPEVDWVTINWPIWGGATGMVGSNDDLAELLSKQGRYFLPVQEGVQILLQEIQTNHSTDRQLVFVHENDRQRLENQVASPAAHPLIDGETHQGSHEFHKTFDLRDDDYLKFHLVSGDASLSAAFEFEMALEALALSFPTLRIQEAYNIELKRFIKVYPGKPKRLTIAVSPSKSDTHTVRALVEIRSQFLHSDGRALGAPVSHWSGEFLLSSSERTEKSISHSLNDGRPDLWNDTPVAGYRSDAKVHYTDQMRSIRNRRTHANGETWSSGKTSPHQDSRFKNFTLPWELMDAAMLTPRFVLQNREISSMPIVTRKLRFYQGLGRLEPGKPSNFSVKAARIEEIPNRQFDPSFGERVLFCPKVEIFTSQGDLLLDLEDTYLMAYI